ncbi:MAG: hypothetical protein RL514_1228 [Verrucomicrobiota bacterium]|jgi:hypothetical protein
MALGRTSAGGTLHRHGGAARGLGHPFYTKLNAVLAEAQFDVFVEDLCAPYYKTGGRTGIPPGHLLSDALHRLLRRLGQSARHCLALRRQPWFLYLAFNAVHTPMHATDDRLAKFPNVADKTRRTYAAMMLAMDDAIGQVRAKLAATGQAENTLITFISDNGGPTMQGVTVNGSVNLPLRGSKRTTLEGGVRVPFIVSWPAKLKPGVFAPPAIQLDLHATALAAAGVATKPEWKLDGVNLLPFLTGAQTGAPHAALYWRFGEQMAVRSGDFKLVRYDTTADGLAGGRKAGASPLKLDNLRDDLGETKDLAAAQPDKVKELQALWNTWNTANVKPLWGGGRADNDGPEPGTPVKKGKKKQAN